MASAEIERRKQRDLAEVTTYADAQAVTAFWDGLDSDEHRRFAAMATSELSSMAERQGEVLDHSRAQVLALTDRLRNATTPAAKAQISEEMQTLAVQLDQLAGSFDERWAHNEAVIADSAEYRDDFFRRYPLLANTRFNQAR